MTYYEPGTVSPFVQGELDHDGSGLSLTGGGKTVELTDFVIDPGKSVLTGTVSVDGKVAAEDAPLFFLDGRTLQPLETTASTATLEGTTVKLKDEAATLLNDTFGTDALKGGLVIGVAKIDLTWRPSTPRGLTTPCCARAPRRAPGRPAARAPAAAGPPASPPRRRCRRAARGRARCARPPPS